MKIDIYQRNGDPLVHIYILAGVDVLEATWKTGSFSDLSLILKEVDLPQGRAFAEEVVAAINSQGYYRNECI